MIPPVYPLNLPADLRRAALGDKVSWSTFELAADRIEELEKACREALPLVTKGLPFDQLHDFEKDVAELILKALSP